jgi:hypothetical protein
MIKECTTMKASTTPKPSKAKTPKAPTAKAAKTPTPDPLAGATIRAEVLTYKPDLHRPRVHITTPTGRYYKLVPGVRTTTKAEALTAAQAYREPILASGQLPPRVSVRPRPPRPPRARPPPRAPRSSASPV